MRVGNSVKIFFIFGLFWAKEAQTDALRCEISAPIAILINADNGKVLFEKNSDQICYPASTTKLATVFYAIYKKGQDLEEVFTASSDAVGTVSSQVRRSSGKHPSYRLEFGGSHVGIRAGEKLDLKTLLNAAMIASANDASNVLAESVSGSVPRFMEELNVFLRAIGCKNTYFTNPHGLSDHNHVTTAFDLALMARFAIKSPLLKKIVETVRYERPQTNKQSPSWFVQTNALLKPGKYYYSPATGIKTGYTEQAGYNLIASAQKEDRHLIVVVCNCNETAKRYRTAVQLFEAAFNEPKQTRKLLSQEHDLFHKKVEGGEDILHASLHSDLTVSFYPSEEKDFHPEVQWHTVSLPIKKGDEVGQVQLFDQKGNLEKIELLLATNDINPTFSYKLERQIEALGVFVKKKRSYFGYGVALSLFSLSFYLVQRKRLKSRRDGLL